MVGTKRILFDFQQDLKDRMMKEDSHKHTLESLNLLRNLDKENIKETDLEYFMVLVKIYTGPLYPEINRYLQSNSF